MLTPESREAASADARQTFSPAGAVAWALTRDKECAELADRDPGKCFGNGGVVFAGMDVAEPYYFDDAEAAWERLRSEIGAGHVRTDPPDWRPTNDEDWRADRLVQIDFDDLQSALPLDGPRFLSSKAVNLRALLDGDPNPQLTIAALWIATKGDSVECNITDVEVWKPAFEGLIKKIRNDEMDLLSRSGDGTLDIIPGYKLKDVSIDYPYQERCDLAFSDTVVLSCSGMDGKDGLFVEGRALYPDLCTSSAQLKKHWPFDLRSSEEYYVLPKEPPNQPAPAHAYRLLSLKYPDGNVPRLSYESLARMLNAINLDPNARPINADAVKRALDHKT
jgi:hypothetical protein